MFCVKTKETDNIWHIKIWVRW